MIPYNHTAFINRVRDILAAAVAWWKEVETSILEAPNPSQLYDDEE